MEEYVILVDSHDVEQGQVEKLKAHQQGVLHRAFSVFVYQHNTEHEPLFLLQKRHRDKYHSGGLWSNSCCGHPRPGELTRPAAMRRLWEETGLHSELVYLDTFCYHSQVSDQLIEHELDHVFWGAVCAADLDPHPEEIETCTWCTAQAINHALRSQPRTFTPWFAPAWQLVPHDLPPHAT